MLGEFRNAAEKQEFRDLQSAVMAYKNPGHAEDHQFVEDLPIALFVGAKLTNLETNAQNFQAAYNFIDPTFRESFMALSPAYGKLQDAVPVQDEAEPEPFNDIEFQRHWNNFKKKARAAGLLDDAVNPEGRTEPVNPFKRSMVVGLRQTDNIGLFPKQMSDDAVLEKAIDILERYLSDKVKSQNIPPESVYWEQDGHVQLFFNYRDTHVKVAEMMSKHNPNAANDHTM